MGGKIWAESAKGQGSCFSVMLPLLDTPVQPHAVASKSAPAAASEPFGRDRWVLLAEDNPVNQVVAGAMLRRLGFQVAVVGDGQQALDVVEMRRDLAAILLDIQMPVLGGFDTSGALRRRERETGTPLPPIIALTAHALDEDRQKCAEAGMNDYLSKPVLIETLARILRTWAP